MHTPDVLIIICRLWNIQTGMWGWLIHTYIHTYISRHQGILSRRPYECVCVCVIAVCACVSVRKGRVIKIIRFIDMMNTLRDVRSVVPWVLSLAVSCLNPVSTSSCSLSLVLHLSSSLLSSASLDSLSVAWDWSCAALLVSSKWRCMYSSRVDDISPILFLNSIIICLSFTLPAMDSDPTLLLPWEESVVTPLVDEELDPSS